MTSLMDREIGKILDALDRLGMADNTLVVFTSDHGHFLGQHGLIAKGPFHYEDVIRVPMIARWPGQIPAGNVDNSIQSLVDYAPTFLSACNIDIPGVMQGLDQVEAWRGNAQAPRDHAIIENRHNPTTMHLRTFVEERYKITIYRNADDGELFDLEEDPGELRNLWSSPDHAGIKSDLLHRFARADLQREPTRMPRISGA